MLRPAVGVLLVFVAACSQGDTDESSAPTTVTTASTSTSTTTVADYVASVEALLADAEELTRSTPEDASNGYGYLTVAGAYRAVARELEEMSPPPDLRLQHGVVIAEAEMIAEEAERVAEMDNPFDRTGAGLTLVRRRDGLRETVESLGP